MGRIFLIIVSIFILGGSVVVYQATRGTRSLVLTPSELLNESRGGEFLRIRIGGKVVEPIQYDVEPAMVLKFDVEDPGTGSNVHIPVVYKGIKPDMFAAGRDVIIDGDYQGGTLIATKLLTQCPSKYEPPTSPDRR